MNDLNSALIDTVKEVNIEKGKTRRAKNMFNAFIAIYLIAIVALAADFKLLSSGPDSYVNTIKIEGVIKAGSDGVSVETVGELLKKAFRDKKSSFVVLEMNSPGGSPVQSDNIYQLINKLKKKHNKPVFAVIGDLCASGCYYIANSADSIYANKNSLIGSIGVVMNSFGFVDTLKKLGVERRQLTSGTSKGFLDPFSPLKDGEVKHVKTLLKDIHENFIEAVKKGRRERLINQDVFNGLIWTGAQAEKLGLIDGQHSIESLLEEHDIEEAIYLKNKTGIGALIKGAIGISANSSLDAITSMTLR